MLHLFVVLEQYCRLKGACPTEGGYYRPEEAVMAFIIS